MNKKANYKIRKVFDSQWDPGMPDDVKKAFFRIAETRSNDCYVSYTIADSVWEEGEGLDYKLLDAWLIENGAEPGTPERSGETVLIKHWW